VSWGGKAEEADAVDVEGVPEATAAMGAASMAEAPPGRARVQGCDRATIMAGKDHGEQRGGR